MVCSRYRSLFVAVFLVVVFICFIPYANAQEGATLALWEEEEEKFYVVNEGEQKEFTLTLQETSKSFNTSVSVHAIDFEDEIGRSISKKSIQITREGGINATTDFLVIKGSVVTVTVTITTKDVKVGTYSGKIIVLSSYEPNIEQKVKIQIRSDWKLPAFLNVVGIVLGFAVLCISGKPPPLRPLKEGETRSDWEVLSNRLFGKINWDNIIANLKKIALASIILFVLAIGTFQGYYSQNPTFGASIFDYGAAILFGYAQFGGSKMTADLLGGS